LGPVAPFPIRTKHPGALDVINEKSSEKSIGEQVPSMLSGPNEFITHSVIFCVGIWEFIVIGKLVSNLTEHETL